jgi:hypothetical protein
MAVSKASLLPRYPHEGNGPAPSEVEGSAARAMVVVKATAARSAVAKRFWLRLFFVVFSCQ